jgi:hypothetical protein
MTTEKKIGGYELVKKFMQLLKPTTTETARLHRLRWFLHVQRMEENRIPKRIQYMNMESTRPRGWTRNRWQDESREDGRIVGGEGWQGQIYRRDEWKKLPRMARNCRILHTPMEWMNVQYNSCDSSRLVKSDTFLHLLSCIFYVQFLFKLILTLNIFNFPFFCSVCRIPYVIQYPDESRFPSDYSACITSRFSPASVESTVFLQCSNPFLVLYLCHIQISCIVSYSSFPDFWIKW